MSNYASMAKRIREAGTDEQLSKLDRSIERIYRAGQFSVGEASRLFVKIMERSAALATEV